MNAVKIIDVAIKLVNTQRSELGAVPNRLSHTVNNLTNISSNLSAAKGGIEDADFAHETSNQAENQILQQACNRNAGKGQLLETERAEPAERLTADVFSKRLRPRLIPGLI